MNECRRKNIFTCWRRSAGYCAGFTPLEAKDSGGSDCSYFLANKRFKTPRKLLTGFTVIELLITIAIIGLLSTLAVVSMSSSRIQAKDARRMSDLKAIQKAIELYIYEFDKAPDVVASTAWSEITNSLSPYLNNIFPQDPDSSKGVYVYCQSSSNNKKYLLAAALEKDNNQLEDIDGVPALPNYSMGNDCVAAIGNSVTINCNDTGGNIRMSPISDLIITNRTILCLGSL